MRVAIMQPYLFPYLGYYQLAAAVDRWVFYDDVMFIKKGFINRNSILVNGAGYRFTVPITNQSQFRAINDHYAIPPFDGILRIIDHAYEKAPGYSRVFPMVSSVLDGRETNIARIAGASVSAVFDYLGIGIHASWSSAISGHQHLKGQERILAICKTLGASEYVNPIGGVELYDEALFASRGIRLRFHRMRPVSYHQGNVPFAPNLSMIDVLMHNDPDRVVSLLRECDLVDQATARSQSSIPSETCV
jgi:WbqC-like protein family